MAKNKNRRCTSENCVYFLCLIDWEGKTLKTEQSRKLESEVIGNGHLVDNWLTTSIDYSPNLKNQISFAKLGFYHSRLIFKFGLKLAPNTIAEIRELRLAIKSEIEKYLASKNVYKVIKEYKSDADMPHIFVYTIFELKENAKLWKFKGEKPYSFATTCFYTELDDIPSGRLDFRTRVFGRKVKLRVSGAKVVASTMSPWFFNNLVNIVFHEGLYRQARQKKLLKDKTELYYGLENRLEDFAGKLMTTFHGYSSESVRRNIQQIAASVAVIGILLTAINVALNLFNIHYFAKHQLVLTSVNSLVHSRSIS